MFGLLKKYWQTILAIALCLAVIKLGNSYASAVNERNKVQADYEWATESLQRSTALLAETRKKLVGHQFDSFEDLKAWVDGWVSNNRPTVVSFLGRNYVVVGNSELYSDYWDCDDIAEAMQRRADLDGYLLSVVLVDTQGCVYGIKVSGEGGHVGCLAVTDGYYWFIEPQTGQIVRIIAKDSPAPSWWQVLDEEIAKIKLPSLPNLNLPQIDITGGRE